MFSLFNCSHLLLSVFLSIKYKKIHKTKYLLGMEHSAAAHVFVDVAQCIPCQLSIWSFGRVQFHLKRINGQHQTNDAHTRNSLHIWIHYFNQHCLSTVKYTNETMDYSYNSRITGITGITVLTRNSTPNRTNALGKLLCSFPRLLSVTTTQRVFRTNTWDYQTPLAKRIHISHHRMFSIY